MREQPRIHQIRKGRRPFGDYVQFEDDVTRRMATKRAFMEGVIYAPRYEYPNLGDLIRPDGGSVVEDERQELREITRQLGEDRATGLVADDEYDLYLGSHERSFKRLMLAQAALRIQEATTPAEQQAARREFAELNLDLYGDMNDGIFFSIMRTEQERVASFSPQNKRAHSIRNSLETYFLVHQFEGDEQEFLHAEILSELSRIVKKRYAGTLSAVPATGEDVTYDPWECRGIMQDALCRSGTGTSNWTVEVNELRDVPSTENETKKIILPGETCRTASQLRRLILHEQEVHARRAENGAASGLAVLEIGTPTYGGPEEGLGVLLECADVGSFENPSYYRARDRYMTAGIALGRDGNPKDARATFGLVWRLIALRSAKDGIITKADERMAKAMAVKHIDNAFRGTNFVMPGVAYMKLKIYYEGLLENIRHFLEHRDDLQGTLDRALIGKYNHTDRIETEKVSRLIYEKRALVPLHS